MNNRVKQFQFWNKNNSQWTTINEIKDRNTWLKQNEPKFYFHNLTHMWNMPYGLWPCAQYFMKTNLQIRWLTNLHTAYEWGRGANLNLNVEPRAKLIEDGSTQKSLLTK